MRIVLLCLALTPVPAFAGERDVSVPASHLALPAAPKVECQNARMGYAIPTFGNPVRAGTLGREPKAGLFLAVQRTEDGCDKPVKIADELGDKQR
ncbi:hypothetical protein [Sphingomonas sp. OTU376]|uniref:hypothetical protein n=1 Tax=Sphingomonas sp. OTU376 TaxID=3043863 RepID=UPI00313ED21F